MEGNTRGTWPLKLEGPRPTPTFQAVPCREPIALRPPCLEMYPGWLHPVSTADLSITARTLGTGQQGAPVPPSAGSSGGGSLCLTPLQFFFSHKARGGGGETLCLSGLRGVNGETRHVG